MKMDGETVQTRFTIKRVPAHGPHPLWCVYELGDLVCGCTYLKGAIALREKLWQDWQTILFLTDFRKNVSVEVRK